jgi:transcriptional regulator GlxA family with amidase domain
MMNEFIEERSTVSNLNPRIVTVIQQLDSHTESQVPLEQFAASVHLSPSRLLSLFKAQMGTPIRRYSLWQRIRVAMEHAVKCKSLTEGAHYAGFTDSAHFSRVFKEMYGINPSGIISKHFPVSISFE